MIPPVHEALLLWRRLELFDKASIVQSELATTTLAELYENSDHVEETGLVHGLTVFQLAVLIDDPVNSSSKTKA